MPAVILFDMATACVTNLRCRPHYIADLTFREHVSKSQNSEQEN